MRTYCSHASLVPPIIGLSQYFNWKRIGVIMETDELFQAIGSILRDTASITPGLTIDTDAIFLADASEMSVVATTAPSIMTKLAATDIRVIVLLAFPLVSRNIMCSAYRRGLAGSRRYAWIMLGQNPPGWWKRIAGDTHDCTDAEMEIAVEGYLAVDNHYYPSAPDTAPMPVSGESVDEWWLRYSARSAAMHYETSFDGPTAYDVRLSPSPTTDLSHTVTTRVTLRVIKPPTNTMVGPTRARSAWSQTRRFTRFAHTLASSLPLNIKTGRLGVGACSS